MRAYRSTIPITNGGQAVTKWRDFPFIEDYGSFKVIPVWLAFAMVLLVSIGVIAGRYQARPAIPSPIGRHFVSPH